MKLLDVSQLASSAAQRPAPTIQPTITRPVHPNTQRSNVGHPRHPDIVVYIPHPPGNRIFR